MKIFKATFRKLKRKETIQYGDLQTTGEHVDRTVPVTKEQIGMMPKDFIAITFWRMDAVGFVENQMSLTEFNDSSNRETKRRMKMMKKWNL